MSLKYAYGMLTFLTKNERFNAQLLHNFENTLFLWNGVRWARGFPRVCRVPK